MIDLKEIAARLDAEEKMRLKYRFPVSLPDGDVRYEIREDRLLDVAEDARILYVSRGGEVIWVKLEEAIEIVPDTGD
ncbi:MAG: hypothetical protein QHI38_08265 [Armatimonadota bacterium]|nr:hypothetical protein [Armatimonadota bacterium]